MDVPSTAKGVVEKVHVAKGGSVSTGALIVTVKAEAGAAAPGTRLPRLQLLRCSSCDCRGGAARCRARCRRGSEFHRRQRPRHGQFRFRRRHRRAGEAGRHRRLRDSAGHARNRQGHHGCAVDRQGRGGEGARRQGRQGVSGIGGRDRQGPRCFGGGAAPLPNRRPRLPDKPAAPGSATGRAARSAAGHGAGGPWRSAADRRSKASAPRMPVLRCASSRASSV